MKNNFILLAILSFILFSCSKTQKEFPAPQLACGTAKLTVKFDAPIPEGTPKDEIMALYNVGSLTGDVSFLIPVSVEDNIYRFDVPMETNFSLVALYYIGFDAPALVDLAVENETVLSLAAENGKPVLIAEKSPLGISGSDMQKYIELVVKLVELDWNNESSEFALLRELELDEYTKYCIDKMLPGRMAEADRDTVLSSEMKNFVKHQYKLDFACRYLLQYEEKVRNSYRNDQSYDGDQVIKRPGLEFYQSLKDMDLNNPQNLYSGVLTSLCELILKEDTLAVPPIEDMPVSDWKKAVRERLNVPDGLFYDILLGHSFGRQFTEEVRPLSDRQKQNIKDYYKGGATEQILLKKNEAITKLDADRYQTVLNETPDIEKEKLTEAIISRYKGKVVLVDIWETWCEPCIRSIKDFGETKNGFAGKDVVFVYLASESSPKNIWDVRVKGIGGEHYYLTDEQRQQVMSDVGASVFPSYVLYDREGNLKRMLRGGQNPKVLKSLLDELLEKE